MASRVSEFERAPKHLLFAKIGHLSGNKKNQKKLKNNDAFQMLLDDIKINYNSSDLTEHARISVLHHL